MELDEDPRITKLGKILRQTSIDEMPQVINILKGDMGLVGPRAYVEPEIKDAKKSVNIVTTEKGFIRKVEGLKGSLEKAKKKGVRIRIVAPITKDNKVVADSLKSFAEVKHNDTVNSRFMTVDGQDVVFMTLDDKDVHPSYDIGVWVKTPYFASAMDVMFNSLWNAK